MTGEDWTVVVLLVAFGILSLLWILSGMATGDARAERDDARAERDGWRAVADFAESEHLLLAAELGRTRRELHIARVCLRATDASDIRRARTPADLGLGEEQ